MILELKRGRDGPDVLTCVRADGSRTWQRLHPFFPLHDLLHYAVETTLAFREAFLGLVAAGRDLGDFASPEVRRGLPAESGWSESIVGLLDQERGTGRRLTAEEFSEALASSLAGQGAPPFRSVLKHELAAIRKLHADLARSWRAVPPGGTLRLRFPSGGAV